MNAPAKLRPVHIRVGSRLLRRELLQPGGEPFLFPGQQLLVLLIFFQRIDTVLVGGFDTLFFFGQSAKRFPYKYQFFIFGRSSDKLFAEFKIFFLNSGVQGIQDRRFQQRSGYVMGYRTFTAGVMDTLKTSCGWRIGHGTAAVGAFYQIAQPVAV